MCILCHYNMNNNFLKGGLLYFLFNSSLITLSSFAVTSPYPYLSTPSLITTFSSIFDANINGNYCYGCGFVCGIDCMLKT
jgi:hypothetical protein